VKKVGKYVAWGIALFVIINGMETINYLIKKDDAPAEDLARWTAQIIESCPSLTAEDMEDAYSAKSEI